MHISIILEIEVGIYVLHSCKTQDTSIAFGDAEAALSGFGTYISECEIYCAVKRHPIRTNPETLTRKLLQLL